MADPFVAEIRIFPFNFAPKGWAFCDGQIMPISQNTALFSLLGTSYGGNGSSFFALPDMQGNAPMFYEQGPGLSTRNLGEMGGSSYVSLLQSEMPAHTHTIQAASTTADTDAPDPTLSLARSHNATIYQSAASAPRVTMSPQALSLTGGGQPHNNMMPYLTLNFCIALQGVYPARN